jgi:hypothetical protein
MSAQPCSRCEAPTDSLALFPGGICLACYEQDHQDDSPEELLRAITEGFGGRS